MQGPAGPVTPIDPCYYAPASILKQKYIPADKVFVKLGEGATKTYGFTRHLIASMTLGISLGLVWKTWHWNEKRYIAQYYADLARKEAREEEARKLALQAKLKELEDELLSS